VAAERCFRAALDIDPQFAAAYFNLSEVASLDEDDEHASQLIGLLPAASRRQSNDQASIYFAAGKAYADRHQFDRAFAAYKQGNDALRPEYDRASNSDRIARAIEVFTRELLAERCSDGEKSDVPIFIVGMPRTGSTLVEQILASHPAVRGLGEIQLISNVAARIASHAQAEIEYPECIPNTPAKVFRGYAGSYLRAVSHAGSTAHRVVDKQLGNFAYLGLITLMFRRAKIIHIARHPLDTCLSCFFRRLGHGGEFSYSLEDLGHYYLSYRKIMEHWEQVVPQRIYHLEYERLVADQETVCRDLLNFCQLDWHDGCMQFHTTARSVSTASASQVRRPLYRTAVRRWLPYRDHLKPLIDILGGIADEDGSDRS
jgi:tetratricopeptide (TPR) repeat protein